MAKPQSTDDSKPARPRGLRAWLRRRVPVCVVAAYLVVAFGFLWPFDPAGPTAIGLPAFMVRTFVFHGGLAVLAIVAIGAVAGSRRTLVAAVPVLIFCVAPEWLPRIGHADVQEPTLRLMSVNVLGSNREFDRVLEQIATESPDVILLQEYKPAWHEALAPVLAIEYPHSLIETRNDAFGCAVYSRLPILEAEWFDLAGAGTPQVSFEVELGDSRVTIHNIHLLPPAAASLTRETWAQLGALVERAKAETGPAIFAGDFNFTPRSAQAGRLRAAGLTEAHSQGGRWRGATWPETGPASLVPGIRLDQAYVSEQLACVSSRVLGRNGSDHRPIVVEIGLRQDD